MQAPIGLASEVETFETTDIKIQIKLVHKWSSQRVVQ